MAIGPELIRGLECAVLESPGNAALRVYLISVLLDDTQPAAALGHVESGLRLDPSREKLQRLAGTARSRLGLGPGPGRGCRARRVGGRGWRFEGRGPGAARHPNCSCSGSGSSARRRRATR